MKNNIILSSFIMLSSLFSFTQVSTDTVLLDKESGLYEVTHQKDGKLEYKYRYRPPKSELERKLLSVSEGMRYDDQNLVVYAEYYDGGVQYRKQQIKNDTIFEMYKSRDSYREKSAHLEYYIDGVEREIFLFEYIKSYEFDQLTYEAYYKRTDDEELVKVSNHLFTPNRFEYSYSYKFLSYNDQAELSVDTRLDDEKVVRTIYGKNGETLIYTSDFDHFYDFYDSEDFLRWQELTKVGDELFNSKQLFYDISLDEAFERAQKERLPVLVYTHGKKYGLKKERKEWRKQRLAKFDLWKSCIPIELSFNDYNETTNNALKDYFEEEYSYILLYTLDTTIVQLQDCERHISKLHDLVEMIDFNAVEEHAIDQAFENGTTNCDTLYKYWKHHYYRQQKDLFPFYKHITDEIKMFDLEDPAQVAIFCLTLRDKITDPQMNEFLALNYDKIRVDREILKLQCFRVCYELEDDLRKENISEEEFVKSIPEIKNLYTYLYGNISIDELERKIRENDIPRVR